MSGTKADIVHRQPVLQIVTKKQYKEIEQVHFCLGTEGVAQDAPDAYPLYVLNNILGGGISSRLFQSIREERGLAYTIYSYTTNYSDAGLMTIYAATRPNNLQEVLNLVKSNICELRNKGISEQELRKTQEQLKGNLMLGLESSSSRMSQLGKFELTLGRFETLDDIVRKIESVTVKDLAVLTQRLFDETKLCLTVLGPVSEELTFN
jgi:predicted Zn-dependent peptidase